MRAPFVIPDSGEKPFTDYTRWRLKADDGGRHIWHYLETDEEVQKWPQSTVDKYWLGLPTVSASMYPMLTDQLFMDILDVIGST